MSGPTAQGDQDALNALLMSDYPSDAVFLDESMAKCTVSPSATLRRSMCVRLGVSSGGQTGHLACLVHAEALDAERRGARHVFHISAAPTNRIRSAD